MAQKRTYRFSTLFATVYISYLILGCSPVGKYSNRDSVTNINLLSDNTFRYFTGMDLLGYREFTGNWRRVKDTIQLNVTDPTDFYVTASDTLREYSRLDLGANKIRIEVLIADGTPVLGARVYVNNNKGIYFVTNASGITDLPGEKIRHLTIVHSNMVTRSIEVNPEINYYLLKIADAGFQPQIYGMIKTKWLWRRSQLTLPGYDFTLKRRR